MAENNFRLIRRNDFDGLMCAVLLKHLDLREEEVIHAGNRFVIYAQFPQCNI